jgi:hypothetical protein
MKNNAYLKAVKAELLAEELIANAVRFYDFSNQNVNEYRREKLEAARRARFYAEFPDYDNN